MCSPTAKKTYDAVHIASHGDSDELRLGNAILTRANLAGETLLHIQSWGESITDEGDILIYGCRVADGDSGESLVKAIAVLTGADVAASTDDTGAAAMGGDWDFEVRAGEVETDIAFPETTRAQWGHLFAPEPPTLTPATATLTEDTAPDEDGNLLATGTITATGGDADEDGFQPQTDTKGAVGSLTIDATGAWRYTAANSHADIQALSPAATLTDTFTVTSADTVTTTTITITITGTDDAPTLTPATATLTEDTAPDEDGNLLASGTVTSSGGDTGEDSFQPQTDTKGAVGSLTIDATGAWRYTAANNHADIQALSPTATLTDTFTVTSADTVTTTTITITIDAADPEPTTPANPDPDDNPGPPATQSANDAPVAADDTGSTDQNTSLTVANDAPGTLDTDGATTNNAGLLLNDTDPNGDTLTITGLTVTPTWMRTACVSRRTWRRRSRPGAATAAALPSTPTAPGVLIPTAILTTWPPMPPAPPRWPTRSRMAPPRIPRP